MMNEHLWTATLTAEQLERWLAPPRTDTPFAILERLTAIDFPGPNEKIALSDWQQGRIFGPKFELRWEKHDNDYYAWLAGEHESKDFTLMALDLSEAKMHKAHCYLWGRDEMRIARQLDYRALPQDKGRPQLIRYEFRNTNGTLIFFRLAGMKWEGDQ